jgi:predicted AlkP superfamily phosphohydrolase/phosphomutase
MPRTAGRFLIIGLDCATPQLILDPPAGDDLKNIRALMGRGSYGRLSSTIPAITCPAWMCMATSKDPGTLGLYGFRNRKDYSYTGLSIGTSLAVKEPTVWDILGREGLTSLIMAVPMTFPPKPLNGWLCTGFLAPDTSSDFCYPRSFREELLAAAPGYQVDVRGFRTENKRELLQQIYDMTAEHFKAIRHMMKTKDWDFMKFVEMGPDRLYHAFWRYCSPDHRLYEPGGEFETAIADYHRYMDEEIGTVLELTDDDDTVLVCSDHGAKTMVGGIAINEWLIQQGYLTLKPGTPTEPGTKVTPEVIDFSRTKVWGDGGYYGRIMLNVEGREPQGQIPQGEYHAFRDQLKTELESLGDDQGNPMGTRIFKPEELYRQVNNIPPDLIAYFGDLDWRSAGTLTGGQIHIFENDTGPDDANHAQQGMFILAGPAAEARGEVEGASLYDVAPTVLQHFGIAVPGDMVGEPMT